jgi:hypothetical protein
MRDRTLLSWALFFAAVTYGPYAWADPEGEVLVHLKNGDAYRGVLVEKVQGDHLTIRLATGGIMLFPWATLAPGDASMALVELDATDPRATLSRYVGSGFSGRLGSSRVQYGSLWENICVAPCGTDVSTRAVYRVEGDGIWPSSSFVLSAGPTLLHVKAGASRAVLGGAVLAATGGGFALMGGMFLGLSAIPVDRSQPDVARQEQTKGAFVTVGAVLLTAGLVGLVTGVAICAGNLTTVTDERGRVIGTARAPRAGSLTPAGVLF